MQAELVARRRVTIADDAFAEIVVWRVPEPVRASRHRFKYRLAYVVAGECILRYDNEAGKGDHRHVGDREEPYPFTSLSDLLDDFFADVETLKR
jgi:hypothetical protein